MILKSAINFIWKKNQYFNDTYFKNKKGLIKFLKN